MHSEDGRKKKFRSKTPNEENVLTEKGFVGGMLQFNSFWQVWKKFGIFLGIRNVRKGRLLITSNKKTFLTPPPFHKFSVWKISCVWIVTNSLTPPLPLKRDVTWKRLLSRYFFQVGRIYSKMPYLPYSYPRFILKQCILNCVSWKVSPKMTSFFRLALKKVMKLVNPKRCRQPKKFERHCAKVI